MKIKLLPSNTNQELQTLTTFLINDRVTLDAGSLAVALTPEEMSTIRHIILTHSHNDHISGLPILIAEAFPRLDAPITVYGIGETIRALQTHIFNDAISPDFSRIKIPVVDEGAVRYQILEPRKTVVIDGLRVTAIPVNHTVPACGMKVEDEATAIIFSGDTYVTDELWQVASETTNLKAIFVDVSYPNELEELARTAKHFTPQSLAADLMKLTREVDIYAMHIKPSNRERVIEELHGLHHPRLFITEIGQIYQW